jgi:hypothetical protein
MVTVVALASGCDRLGSPLGNLPPDTGISAGPPEGGSVGTTAHIYWWGSDEDGRVVGYQIAWDAGEDWSDAVTATDSVVAFPVDGSCCGDPDEPTQYSQIHTFRVRAVDEDGAVDETPATRTFVGHTVAPVVRIVSGPELLGTTTPDVTFVLYGEDDDGYVQGYWYRATWFSTYVADTRNEHPTIPELMQWLTRSADEHLDTEWVYTESDTVRFTGLPLTPGDEKAIFAVLAVDNSQARQRTIDTSNFRLYDVIAPNWVDWIDVDSDHGSDSVEVFVGEPLHFEWRGGAGRQWIVQWEYALDQNAWTPLPPSPPLELEPPAGDHVLWIRWVDDAGRSLLHSTPLHIYPGPVPSGSDQVLVVLDTTIHRLVHYFPPTQDAVEQGLFQDWLAGRDFTFFVTGGVNRPPISQLSDAAVVIWVLTADSVWDDPSALRTMQWTTDPPSDLPAYLRVGGHLLLAGVRPHDALRYFQRPNGTIVEMTDPVDFAATLGSSEWAPHWLAAQGGVGLVRESREAFIPELDDRLRVARAVRAGYPDLPFDPLSWPNGPQTRGAGFFDVGIETVPGAAEPLYRLNDTDDGIGTIAWGPDGHARVVYLGFHPCFVDHASFGAFLQAALADFGLPGLP